MICESSSFIPFTSELSRHWDLNFQLRNEGERLFSSISQPSLRECGQYYALAVATLFFYDYFLTLADEVSHLIGITFRQAYHPSCERSNTLGVVGNHGVRREHHLGVRHSLTM